MYLHPYQSIYMYVHTYIYIYICVQVIMWIYVDNSFGYIPMSGISGSYGNSVFNNLRTVLKNEHIIFCPTSRIWILILFYILANTCC
jgi:hypothetical protein